MRYVNNLTNTGVALADNGDFQCPGCGAGGPMMSYGGGWGFGVLGWIGSLLFWALIIAAIVFLIKSFTKKDGSKIVEREAPIEILEKRYAKGEISKEEFEKIKSDLGGNKQ